MARRPFVPRGRSGGVHNKEWEVACLNGTSSDLAIGTTTAFQLFVADEAETILRLRGEIMLTLDAAAVVEEASIAIGIATVSSRAVAAGSASLPRPGSEGSYPWFWHGWGHISSGREAAVNTNQLFVRIPVDSKAMRKIKEDEDVALVFEVCESTDATGSYIIHGGFRILTGD